MKLLLALLPTIDSPSAENLPVCSGFLCALLTHRLTYTFEATAAPCVMEGIHVSIHPQNYLNVIKYRFVKTTSLPLHCNAIISHVSSNQEQELSLAYSHARCIYCPQDGADTIKTRVKHILKRTRRSQPLNLVKREQLLSNMDW